MKLGVVCGLKSEAAALAGCDAAIAISGASADRAYAKARELAEDGVAALVSFGLSGALRSGLRPGTLIVPSVVVAADGGRYDVAPAPTPAPVGTVCDPVLGTDTLVTSAAEKIRLQNVHGACAVDMESHAVAQAAREAGLPLFVIRAVADPADQVLPPSAAAAVAPDGGVRTGATLAALMRRPADLPVLVSLGLQSAKGTATLRGAGRALIAGLVRA